MEQEIKKALKKILKKEVILEIPPDSKLGDYAFPCFSLAKQSKKNPNEIALDLSKKIKGNFKVEAKGPYLNFFIDKTKLAKQILKDILNKKDNYGKIKLRRSKKILIESPGPNTNKPLHLGHLRNIFLSTSIKNILNSLGNKALIVDIVNDRGIHISQSMLAYKLYGKNKKPNIKSDHFVGKFYVLYNKKLKENPNLEKKTSELLVKWEDNDKETIQLWKKMNKWALDGFKETYKVLNFNVDKTYYESNHYKEGKKIILEGLKKGIFQKDKSGAISINLKKENLGNKILLRSDGTSVYVTQDLSLAIKRYKDFKMNKMIYIVASEQIYHFKVLFSLLKKLNKKFAQDCYHLSYGMVNLPEGKMKSREGSIVDADNLIGDMINLAKEEIKIRYIKISKKEVEKRAKSIGLGALIFFILKIDPFKDMTFNPKESIKFEGDTGPYIQYVHARCNSILKKIKKQGKTDFMLFNEIDLALVKKLNQYNEIIIKSGQDYKPSLIANYLLDLSKSFNEFYSKNPVKNANLELKNSRLDLVKATKQIIKNGLNLLNIEAPNEM